jgi:signal transduction histidine kinase/ligand-binding sensor domain-containing protein
MKKHFRNRAFPKAGRFLLYPFVFLFLFVSTVFPERLPIKIYTAADGLATSIIHDIIRDSEGFLWFSGRGGLSRFNGARFISYRFSETENAPLVHRFLESRDRKVFWILTDKAVYRTARSEQTEIFPVADSPRDERRRLPAKKLADRGFWAIHETLSGELLFGGSDGLFIVENPTADQYTFREIEFSRTAKAENRPSVRAFVDGPDGSLWIATDAGLIRRTPDNRFLTYEMPRVIALGDEAYGIQADSAGRVWIAFRSGVFVLAPDPLETLSALPDLTARALPIEEIKLVGNSGEIRLPEKPGEMFKISFETDAARAGQAVTASVQEVFQSSDGKIWIPAAESLYVVSGGTYRKLRDPSAMPGTSRPVVEDLRGNLWFGTASGVVKYTRGGLTSYTADSGLAEPNIHLIQETPAGELLVVHGNWLVSRLTPDGFDTLSLNLAENARYSWTSFPVVQDVSGGLWALQTGGLFRFSQQQSFESLVKQTPSNVSETAKIFENRFFYRAFNDRLGNVWFAANSPDAARRTLLKFSPQTGEWQDLSELPGFPQKRIFASFAEDGKGNFWFGFYGSGGLVKLSGGRFTEFSGADGFPRGSSLELLYDRRGRLWVASTEEGVARIDNPSAETPEFVRYTENEGLTSANVRCLTEDLSGNVYAGTVRGVSRINPDTGQISPITTADGLAADFVKSAFRDRRGVLWFGTSNGLSRYEPNDSQILAAPPVYIGDLKIAGVNYAVSEFGQREIGNIETSASENNLQIDFFSIAEVSAVRYQFKLDGAENADWSAPTEQRAVNFANLPPGEYRFSVRAVNASGAVSENPAVVAFTIRPPFWKTWWFILLAAIFVTFILYFIYRRRTENLRRINAALMEAQIAEEKVLRAREEKLAELERVRTRIATDLHDDIGSSLTQIAVLSEVAQNQASSEDSEEVRQPLQRISTVTNELVETMSDIVWAINPRKDSLLELIKRMRRFASDVLSARDIFFDFETDETIEKIQLGANIRREIFSIFKESVNNVVRHSGAREVVIDLTVEREMMQLKIRDDGHGFDTRKVLSEEFSPDKGGNGLINMRRRAVDLGGSCRIESNAQDGTLIFIEIPLQSSQNGDDIHLTQAGGAP